MAGTPTEAKGSIGAGAGSAVAGRTAADYEREQQTRDQSRTWWRLRRHVRPLQIAAAAGVWVAIWWGIDAATVSAGGSPISTAVAALHLLGYPLLGLVAVAVRRHRHKRRLMLGAATALAWAAVSIALGPSTGTVAALVVATLMLAAGYWRPIRIGYPGEAATAPRPVAEQEPAVVTGPDRIVQDWKSYATKALPGTWLEPTGGTEFTYDFRLHLKRGEQTIGSVYSMLDRLATALDVPIARLVAETTDDLPPSQAIFKVIHTPPMPGPLRFDGPRFRDGICSIGPYQDGIGEAPYRLYTEGSMWSGFIVGATGAGKSRLAENIAISGCSDPIDYPTVLLYTDPQDGVSSPALADYALAYTSTTDTSSQVEAVARIAKARQLESAAHGWTGFVPGRCTCPDPITAMTSGQHSAGCTYRPGIFWVIEEAHKVFADKFLAAVFTGFAREFRKLGIGLLALSQHSDQDQFGGKEVLRQSLTTGNVICLRTSSRTTGTLIADLDFDPALLPKGIGYCYTVATCDAARNAPARARGPVDPDNPAISIADRWLTDLPRLQLDPLAQQVAGDWFAARTDRSQEDDRAERQRELILLRAGDPGAIARVYEGTARDLGLTASAPSIPENVSAHLAAWEAELAEATTAVSALEWPSLTMLTDPDAARRTRDESAAIVLAHLRGGATRLRELCDATGWSHTYIRQLLTTLEQDGHASKTGHGQWAAESNTAPSTPGATT